MTSREILIENNMGLVHACARRFIGKGIEYDDLFQAGCVGLVKAAGGFDESLGFAFSTYAVPAVLGEIKRLFRDGGAVKVSRALKEKSREIMKLSAEMSAEFDREPTVSEIAERTGLTACEVSELLLVSQPPVSLTDSGEGSERQFDLPVAGHEENITEQLSLGQCLGELGELERRIIEMRYFQGLTQSVCAERLGMSQVQVSRREKSILLKMREKMVV